MIDQVKRIIRRRRRHRSGARSSVDIRINRPMVLPTALGMHALDWDRSNTRLDEIYGQRDRKVGEPAPQPLNA